VRGAAREEDHDDRLVIDPLGRFSGRGLRREQLGQTRATEGEAADLEEGTARETVTEFSRVISEDGEHGGEGWDWSERAEKTEILSKNTEWIGDEPDRSCARSRMA